MFVSIVKYDTYQSFDNYGSLAKSHTEATQKPHRSHTIKKNVKNDKNEKKTTPVGYDYDSREFYNITEKDIKQWKKAYPAVDIELSTLQAAQWLFDNPTKRKSQYRRFLTNWFSRNQERGGNKNEPKKTITGQQQFKSFVDQEDEALKRRHKEQLERIG